MHVWYVDSGTVTVANTNSNAVGDWDIEVEVSAKIGYNEGISHIQQVFAGVIRIKCHSVLKLGFFCCFKVHTL